MHARVTTSRVPSAALDAAIQSISSTALPQLREQGAKTMLLVNRETGEAMAISFWEDEASMNASEERARALRDEAAERSGADVSGVTRYEVAVSDLG